jgi:putative ABC transport system permease protein
VGPHGGPRWRAVLAAVLAEGRAASGRLVFFTGALAVGVAAVVGVSALVGAFEAGLRAESRTLLGGDLRASARRALPEALDAVLADVPHRAADLRELAATASFDGRSRLVELKAASRGYPFAGDPGVEPASVDARGLSPEQALIAPELAAELGLSVGDRFALGGAQFEVAGLVLDEPDRLEFQMALGPRVLISLEGFERTELDLALSRVRYARVWAFEEDLDASRLEGLERRLIDAAGGAEYLQVQNHTEAQPTLRRALGQVGDFLGLVALLSLLLGGIGVAQIVRAWLSGRTQAVAVLRCIGLRARELAAVYLGNVALLALIGSSVGALLGALAPLLVRELAPELFAGTAGSFVQPWAVLRGIGLGVGVALLFSLPSLTAVWRVAPAIALRAEAAPLPPPRSVRVGAPVVLASGLLLVARVQGGSWLEAAAFTGGLALLTLALWLGARAVAWGVARAPRGRVGPTLEHGLAALARPGAGTTGAIVALGLGVMVVGSMWLVESGLQRSFAEALPEQAPSLFLVDIQPDQWPAVREELTAFGAVNVDSTPVAMGRLRSVDGRPVAELARERRDTGRSAWMFTRELRLTWSEELPPDNQIVSGALWSEPDAFEISLEQDYAEDLGADVGSTITLDVQGVEIELLVTSIRTVEWESFGINFFMVVEPGPLDDAPHWRLAVARIEPPERELELQAALAGEFGNVTVLRVRPLLEKLSSVFARVSAGVRGLGSFTILTGLVILAGSVASSALRRGREAALLKSLGVTRGIIVRLFAVEYALIGLVAGSIGAVGAVALAWVFLTRVAGVNAAPHLAAVPVAGAATAALALVSGLLASTRPLATPPMATLRG